MKMKMIFGLSLKTVIHRNATRQSKFNPTFFIFPFCMSVSALRFGIKIRKTTYVSYS